MAAIDLISKALWFRNSTLPGSGSVTTWTDSSGNGYNLAVTGATIATGVTPNGAKAITGSTLAGTLSTLGMVQGTYVHVTGPSQSSFVTANLTDGDASTLWSATSGSLPITITYRIRSAADSLTYTTAVVTEYTIRNGGTAANSPTAWTFQGSNDGSSWTTLDTVSGATTTANTSTAHSFSNSTAYEYYKWVITARNGGSSVEWLMATLTGVSTGKTQRDGELWVVLKRDTTGGVSWRLGTSGQNSYYDFSGTTVYDDTGSTIRRSFTPSLSVNAWRTYRVRAEGTNWTAYIDGNAQSGSSSSATKSWAVSSVAPIVGWSGWIAEWILFDHALDSTEVTTVTDYLQSELFVTPVTAEATSAGSVTATAEVGHETTATITSAGTVAGSTVTNLDATATVTSAGTVAATGVAAVSGDFSQTASTSSAGGVTSTAVVGKTATATVTSAGAVTSVALGDVLELDVSVDLLVLSSESQSPIVETDGAVLLDATVDLVVRHQMTPVAPPLGVLTEYPVKRTAHLMPALSAALPRRMGVVDLAAPDDYLYRIETSPVGRFHVFVDGVDVTFLRDSPLRFDDVTTSAQVGPLSASLTVPQMRPWDEPGEGDLAIFDMNADPRVEVVMVREDDSVDYVLEGALATDEDSSGPGREDYSFHAEGALMQAAHEPYDPPLFLNPTDPGWVVADVLNSVTHRRYMKVKRFTTGMPKVTDRGQQGQSKWQRALDVLSKCIDDDGRQLAIERVGPWDFQMAWKQDTTAADYTVTKGAPGVEVALRVDQSTRRDCIYGRGVDPEGGVWGNYFFVGLDFFTPPLYPMAGFANITVGTTDGDTTTGNGVTLVEQRMRDLGYRVTIDGVWTSSDNAWVDDIQRARGITVDSSLGPQTWSAIFELPADAAFDVVRRPLAGVSDVEPFLYNANGSIAGENPSDNPKKIRHAMPEVDFGLNIWKRDAVKLAQKMLLRDAVPAHVGTITLTSDPWESGTSRFDIKPGDNVQVIGHRGDVIVQVAEVSHDDVTVTLTVDSKARDALALDAILERDRDARRDPSGRTARTTDMSSLNKSEVVQYESESRAGFYPRTAINGNSGLWTVLPMFVSQVGVAKVEFYAKSPKAEMVVALFEKPITANRLASYIPDPLSSKEGWYDNVEVLENSHGMTEIFGTPESPFGYWPRQKGDAGATLTGVGKDRASTLYSSKYGGIMWVAVFTSVSTWVEGRCFPANGR